MVGVERIDLLGLLENCAGGGEDICLTQSRYTIGIQVQNFLKRWLGWQIAGTIAGRVGGSFEQATAQEKHVVILSRPYGQGTTVQV